MLKIQWLFMRACVVNERIFSVSGFIYWRLDKDENVMTSKLINFMAVHFDERFKVNANKLSNWRKLWKKVTPIFMNSCRWEIPVLFIAFWSSTVYHLPPIRLWNFDEEVEYCAHRSSKGMISNWHLIRIQFQPNILYFFSLPICNFNHDFD